MRKQQNQSEDFNSKKRKMVVHHGDRLWTRLERERNYQFGMTYVARYGYEKFKRMGKNYFNEFFIF